MEENYNDNQSVESENKKQDCGCDDGCCQPKKKNTWSKWIFALILLAAIAIIGIKLTGRSDNASAKQTVVPGKAACCDTSKAGSKTCDTTKGSSCCSKK
jgi:hypothetical protein